MRDIRMAIRALRSWPLGAVAAILTLAVAIGSTIAMGAGVTFAVARSTFVEFARLSAASPFVWCTTVLLCACVATITCLLATRRIVTLEPWVVLRRT